MYQHRMKHWEHGGRAQIGPQSIEELLERAEARRGAALARMDYAEARDCRIEIAIIEKLREATDTEIRSGQFFE